MRFSLYWYCVKRLFLFPPHPRVFLNFAAYLLNQHVFKRTVLRFHPISVVLYLTKRCNFKCTFCYAETVLDRRNHETDLTLDQLKELLETPYGKNALRLGLLGGEPFMNPQIFELLAEIKRRGKITTIVSNASLIKGETLDRLLKSDLDVLGLSLYANNRPHIERVVKAVNGKLQYWVQTVISADRIHEMEEIAAFADSIGCRNLHFSNCVPIDGQHSDPPIYEGNQEYLAMEARLKRNYAGRINIDWVNLLPRPKAERKRACAMPFSYVHLDNKGNLGACCMRAPNGSLYGNVFQDKDSWNLPFYRKLRESMLDPKQDALDVCRGCDNLHKDLYQI